VACCTNTGPSSLSHPQVRSPSRPLLPGGQLTRGPAKGATWPSQGVRQGQAEGVAGAGSSPVAQVAAEHDVPLQPLRVPPEPEYGLPLPQEHRVAHVHWGHELGRCGSAAVGLRKTCRDGMAPSAAHAGRRRTSREDLPGKRKRGRRWGPGGQGVAAREAALLVAARGGKLAASWQAEGILQRILTGRETGAPGAD